MVSEEKEYSLIEGINKQIEYLVDIKHDTVFYVLFYVCRDINPEKLRNSFKGDNYTDIRIIASIISRHYKLNPTYVAEVIGTTKNSIYQLFRQINTIKKYQKERYEEIMSKIEKIYTILEEEKLPVTKLNLTVDESYNKNEGDTSN